MNREDFEKKSWIPIARSLPGNMDKDWYIAWNPILKIPFCEQGYVLANHGCILLYDFENFIEAKEKFAVDRIFSHWRPVFGPEKRRIDVKERIRVGKNSIKKPVPLVVRRRRR